MLRNVTQTGCCSKVAALFVSVEFHFLCQSPPPDCVCHRPPNNTSPVIVSQPATVDILLSSPKFQNWLKVDNNETTSEFVVLSWNAAAAQKTHRRVKWMARKEKWMMLLLLPVVRLRQWEIKSSQRLKRDFWQRRRDNYTHFWMAYHVVNLCRCQITAPVSEPDNISRWTTKTHWQDKRSDRRRDD